jgi:hypothetical protein
MHIYEITDRAFKPYGRILAGYETTELLTALKTKTPLPVGTNYVPEEPALQSLPSAATLGKVLFGGLAVQFGWCNGHNTTLNCLEYHRSSEVLLGTEDFILLLAKQDEITDWTLDTSVVKAFRAPAGKLVELYATTLHYAPCHTDAKKGFRVMVALPRGTNTAKPDIIPASQEDTLLRANNKWLIAHPDADEAGDGAYVGLTGQNINLDTHA